MYYAPIFGKGTGKRCNQITAPPLLRIGLCLQRIEAAAGLAIGFIERIQVRGSRKWSTQTICAAFETRVNLLRLMSLRH